MTAAQVYTWVPLILAGSRKGDMDDCLMACHMRYRFAYDRGKGPVLPFTLVRGQLYVPTNKTWPIAQNVTPGILTRPFEWRLKLLGELPLSVARPPGPFTREQE